MSEQERQRRTRSGRVRASKQERGRELRCGRLTKAIRKREQRSLPHPPSEHLACLAWICVAKACEEPAGISGNTVDFCLEREKWHFFQDALRLSVSALRSGGEGQDLGLPLLHVLGKESGTWTRAGARDWGKGQLDHGKRSRFFLDKCCIFDKQIVFLGKKSGTWMWAGGRHQGKGNFIMEKGLDILELVCIFDKQIVFVDVCPNLH